MATYLSNSNNISVTLVPDSAVYALMSKVHKVSSSSLSSLITAGALLPSSSHGRWWGHLLCWPLDDHPCSQGRQRTSSSLP
jgi:hypothetical protein